MLNNLFPIKIAQMSENISTKILLVEVRQTPIVEQLSKFQISLSESLLKKMESRGEEKFFTLYPENSQFEKVLVFFPNEEKIFDDRSEMIRNYSKNVAYFPDGNISDAFEIFTLASYEFSFYKTKKEDFERFFLVENAEQKQEISTQIPLLSAIIAARNLVNMPPQDLNPETFVKIIQEKKWKNFDVKIFGNSELRSLGCNLIRAVGKGSARENFMVVFQPKNDHGQERYGFIGKWVTFDAGGIQIKPDKAMLDMKCDMAGAAGMLGLAMVLDEQEKLPIYPVIAMGLVENMTGASAFKPLDIYSAYNGTTVEIHHTDAEWRLVLADVMSYVEKNYRVKHLITMATLTGACLHALGNDISGIVGNDEELIEKILQQKSIYEPLWRLPLPQKLIESVKSDIADIKNISDGVYMGSSLWGAFLTYFQGDAMLTHLDIAGPAYRSKPWGYMPVGGTGWGVKILSEVILQNQLSE